MRIQSNRTKQKSIRSKYHSHRPSLRLENLESRRMLAILVESGDFTDEIARLKSLVFLEGSDDYDPPTQQEENDFRVLADTLLAGDLQTADTLATQLDYELVEFTDTVSETVYHGLREELVNDVTTRGWGSYFINLNFTSDALVEIPHPLHDTHTPEIGANVFRDSAARGLLMAGAHRDANGPDTADVAHLDSSIFQEVHESWIGQDAHTETWQIHAFDIANHGGFPQHTEVVLSNGDGHVSEEVIDLDGRFDDHGFPSYAHNKLDPNDPLNVLVNEGLDGTTFHGLAGQTNVQRQYTTSQNGRFIHIELERDLRFNTINRALSAELIGASILTQSGGQVVPDDDEEEENPRPRIHNRTTAEETTTCMSPSSMACHLIGR